VHVPKAQGLKQGKRKMDLTDRQTDRQTDFKRINSKMTSVSANLSALGLCMLNPAAIGSMVLSRNDKVNIWSCDLDV